MTSSKVLPPINTATELSPCSVANSDGSPGLGYGRIVGVEDREWDEASEAYLRSMRVICARNTQRCRDSALWARKMHTRLALPTVIIPIVMTPFSQLDECETKWAKHVATVIFILLSLLNGLNTYFDFSKRSERCMSSSHKYAEIMGDLDYELSKPTAHRGNVNVVTTRLRHSVSALDKSNWWVMAHNKRHVQTH